MPANRHPRPDRSKFAPQQSAKLNRSREFDAGRDETTLPDGRPCVIEVWYDVETGLDLRTFFYSRSGIEDWTTAQHLEALAAIGYLSHHNDHHKGATILSSVDASGQEVWSVTVVENSVPN